MGLAPIKFLAKIASDLNKPDGLTIIEPAQVQSFIDTLPIRKVPGVGRRTMKILSDIGIETLGQVNGLPDTLLAKKLGKFGHRLRLLAGGRDDAKVVAQRDTKSVSTETTLSEDTRDRSVLAPFILRQSQSVARQLRHIKMRARTVTLILKTADFQRHTRSLTLESASQSSDTIYQTAMTLLNEYPLQQPVRLVGVGATGLQPETKPVQMGLFSEDKRVQDGKWEKVDQALDALSDRFGVHAVTRGSNAELDRRRK